MTRILWRSQAQDVMAAAAAMAKLINACAANPALVAGPMGHVLRAMAMELQRVMALECAPGLNACLVSGAADYVLTVLSLALPSYQYGMP